MGSRRRAAVQQGLALALFVAVVTAAGCASDAETPPGATVPEVGPTTTRTAAADAWAVPHTIDAAYVERVLAELDRIDGDAARIIVAEGELVRPAVDRMRAIYGTDELNFNLEHWGEHVVKQFEGFRRPPGNRRSVVEEVITGSNACVFAAVSRDFSAIAEQPTAPRTSYITLTREEPAFDPENHNPTGWQIDSVRVPQGNESPTNKCAA